MAAPDRKRRKLDTKLDAKREKKRAKAELKRLKRGDATATIASPASPTASEPPAPSVAVRYAEAVRGILYVVLGLSLVAGLVLGQRGVILSLNDLIDGLFVALAGKIVLALIGAALLISGLKHLRLVR